MIRNKRHKQNSPLFGHWEETLIWSCLQGIMGKYMQTTSPPLLVAMAVIGFHLFAGEPAPELIAYRPPHCTQNFMIAVPQNKLWENMLTQFTVKSKIISRYATKRPTPIFNKHHLEKSSLPAKTIYAGLP